MNFVRVVSAHLIGLALFVVIMHGTNSVENSQLPVFDVQSWKFEMNNEQPKVKVVNGIEHVVFEKGIAITLVRK